MYAQTSGTHADRVVIFLTPLIGPLTQDGPLAGFDPRRDVEIYVDGVLVPVRTAFFNSVQNSYVLFMDRAIDVQGIIQVMHHMPDPSFVDDSLVVLASFALIASFVVTPDNLLVDGISLGGVPDTNVFVNGDLVSSDYIISVNGA